MRRLLVAAGLAALLATGCLWSIRRIDHTAQVLSQQIAADEPAAAYAYWTQSQTLLGSFLLHQELDEVSRLLVRMQAARETDPTEYALCRAECLAQVEHLTELDRPIWKNLF